MATNPKMAPCPNGHSADYLNVYSYDSGTRRVECDHVGCWYTGPCEGSIRQAIKSHNAKCAAKEQAMTIRPFTRELRKQGFEFCWRDRTGGVTTTQFAKRQGDRELHVQLWGDGKHRVSHGTHGRYGLRETTSPTCFETVDEMLAAIKTEWERPSGPGHECSNVQRMTDEEIADRHRDNRGCGGGPAPGVG